MTSVYKMRLTFLIYKFFAYENFKNKEKAIRGSFSNKKIEQYLKQGITKIL